MAQSHPVAPETAAGAVLTKASLRAAERLGLSGRQLADIVGVSEATVSRWKRGESLLEQGSKAFELAALLVRCFRSLDCDHRRRRSRGAALADRAQHGAWGAAGFADGAGAGAASMSQTYLDARRAPL